MENFHIVIPQHNICLSNHRTSQPLHTSYKRTCKITSTSSISSSSTPSRNPRPFSTLRFASVGHFDTATPLSQLPLFFLLPGKGLAPPTAPPAPAPMRISLSELTREVTSLPPAVSFSRGNIPVSSSSSWYRRVQQFQVQFPSPGKKSPSNHDNTPASTLLGTGKTYHHKAKRTKHEKVTPSARFTRRATVSVFTHLLYADSLGLQASGLPADPSHDVFEPFHDLSSREARQGLCDVGHVNTDVLKALGESCLSS